MDDKLYRTLKYTALVLGLSYLVFSLYEGFFQGKDQFTVELGAAHRAFEDGRLDDALHGFDKSLELRPGDPYALYGKGITLMRMDRDDEALEDFNQAINNFKQNPEGQEKTALAVIYANRGLLFDARGKYQKALDDYTLALRMDEKVKEGAGIITRLMKNQPEKPPTVLDRARYLKEQLALPVDQRQLRDPELDEKQPPLKM